MTFSTERLVAATLDRVMPGIQSEITTMFTEPVSRYLPPSCQQLHTAEAVDHWLDEMEKTGAVLRLVLQNQPVGYLFVFPEPNQCYRVGYVLAEACWGKGLATEAMQGLITYLRNNDQGASFIAGVEADNKGSVNVLVKLGFSFGYTEQDVDYYQL
ncbi:GNAT family N-acetyltransferase [Photobacterium sanctipauli]|nr:GNAT family N-acetyltransferase [Photobacterium sanctipauli]